MFFEPAKLGVNVVARFSVRLLPNMLALEMPVSTLHWLLLIEPLTPTCCELPHPDPLSFITESVFEPRSYINWHDPAFAVPTPISVRTDLIAVAPFASENTYWNVWLAPFPELGVTDTSVGTTAAFTTCDSADDVLAAKLPSPAYDAVIECVPCVNAEVANVVFPVMSSAPMPSVVVPSRNVTIPVGTVVPEAGVTVAVKVTNCPTPDGLADDATAVVVDTSAAFTTCDSDDVLGAKLPSPPYDAVIECVPWVSAAVANVAVPVLSSAPVPSVVAPSKNVTVPVGVPVPDVGATVTVNVTDCPTADGLAEELSVVVVAANDIPFTPCDSPDDVLAAKPVSPPYDAVIECRPCVRAVVANVAFPVASSAPVPSVVAPSRNVTVPVGTVVPEAGVTVAVKVTDCPTVDGLADDVTAVVVDTSAAFTTCDNADDVLAAKLVLPPYDAVIVCVPCVSAAVANVAFPVASSAPVPSVVAPSRNVTVPVGTVVPEAGVTVAVKVTDCPTVDGLADDATTVVVDTSTAFTTCDSADDVLAAKLALPPYDAVIECVPCVSAEVANVAFPVASSAPVPSVVAPSRNVTVPVGTVVPEAGVTVAVKVTDCPTVDGLADDATAVVVDTSAAFTTCDKADDVLAAKPVSPPYNAVIVCVPCVSAAVANVAFPVASSAPVPSVVAPSRNVTVPVGTVVP